MESTPFLRLARGPVQEISALDAAITDIARREAAASQLQLVNKRMNMTNCWIPESFKFLKS